MKSTQEVIHLGEKVPSGVNEQQKYRTPIPLIWFKDPIVGIIVLWYIWFKYGFKVLQNPYNM